MPLAVLVGCTPAHSAATASAPVGSGATVATVALAALPVKGRSPLTGYSRAAFGAAWADTDHNGCDTRDDVLRRQLAHVQLRPGTHGCVVLAGVLSDPYTGASLRYVRGRSVVDIDHVDALAEDWQTGASRWSPARRLALANDPLNLLAVSARANRQKGDADAASWLPPLKAERCPYVARQIAVKVRYGLWVTPAEEAAMRAVLDRCPGERLPTGGAS